MTFGIIETRAAQAFLTEPAADHVRIANPLSASFDVLRVSLLPGLVDAVARNRRHGRRDVGLFEIGARFSATRGETRGVAVAWTGAATVEHWSTRPREVDFFDVKGATVPAAVSVFPRELYQAPRSWAEQAYPNLIYFNEVDRGNHFAAWQEPDLFTTEVRAAFRSLR